MIHSSFTQEVSTYAENSNINDSIFDDYFATDDINKNVGFLTNKITPYSMLIDIFKEMTNHLEGHYTMDDINKIRAYISITKLSKQKKSNR